MICCVCFAFFLFKCVDVSTYWCTYINPCERTLPPPYLKSMKDGLIWQTFPLGRCKNQGWQIGRCGVSKSWEGWVWWVPGWGGKILGLNPFLGGSISQEQWDYLLHLLCWQKTFKCMILLIFLKWQGFKDASLHHVLGELPTAVVTSSLTSPHGHFFVGESPFAKSCNSCKKKGEDGEWWDTLWDWRRWDWRSFCYLDGFHLEGRVNFIKSRGIRPTWVASSRFPLQKTPKETFRFSHTISYFFVRIFQVWYATIHQFVYCPSDENPATMGPCSHLKFSNWGGPTDAGRTWVWALDSTGRFFLRDVDPA